MAQKKLIDTRGRVPKKFVSYRTRGGLRLVINLDFERRFLVEGHNFQGDPGMRETGPLDLTKESLEAIALRAPKNAVGFVLSVPYDIHSGSRNENVCSSDYIKSVWAVQYYRHRRKGE
ncbi:MAG: hypothetical protein KKF46_05810 [Nanoarchaeota archaeon]|nr:hypothetical protein [Nanoarchaeota archaeon]MBU1321848.1 hypothetical protein [Nanoarchaeota archaeon]MBU1597193.1 hypothetical protein [Nanoarchaeota archaeon]MBU2441892.1 hypothetical protein [Nanoarchaeota archaeon]